MSYMGCKIDDRENEAVHAYRVYQREKQRIFRAANPDYYRQLYDKKKEEKRAYSRQRYAKLKAEKIKNNATDATTAASIFTDIILDNMATILYSDYESRTQVDV